MNILINLFRLLGLLVIRIPMIDLSLVGCFSIPEEWKIFECKGCNMVQPKIVTENNQCYGCNADKLEFIA